jgi:hypothetical protein
LKTRKTIFVIIFFFLTFESLSTFIIYTRGASIDPNNPTLLTGSTTYYTTWNPANKSEYYQVKVSESNWYVLGINSSQYFGSLKFSTQPDYGTTEFQHPSINNWKDIYKYINLSRADQSVFGMREYMAQLRKSDVITLNDIYEDSTNKIKYNAYILHGDVFIGSYLGGFFEVQLTADHTYEIGYDISTSGSANIAISIIVFKESGGFLYGSKGGNNAEAWSGANVAELSSFQPSSTGTYLIIAYEYGNNEFVPSEFHIYDTSENLWEDIAPPIIPGYSILILGFASISIIFLLTKKFKS